MALAQLAVVLAEDPSPGGFLRFGLYFVPVWWAWTGYTMYADRFDTDDLVFRIMMLAGMLAIAALAVGVPEAFSARFYVNAFPNFSGHSLRLLHRCCTFCKSSRTLIRT